MIFLAVRIGFPYLGLAAAGADVLELLLFRGFVIKFLVYVPDHIGLPVALGRA